VEEERGSKGAGEWGDGVGGVGGEDDDGCADASDDEAVVRGETGRAERMR
jgi:hypothetical protein